MKTTSAEHGQNMCACSFHGNSMNNLLSFCGLIDAKRRASDKDLPVGVSKCNFNSGTNCVVVIFKSDGLKIAADKR